MVAKSHPLRTIFRLAKLIDERITRDDTLLSLLESAYATGDVDALSAAALAILHEAEARG